MSYPNQVEAKDVKFTQIELDQANGSILQLRGFIFHSALAVDQVSIADRDGARLVSISLVPVRSGRDGNFAIAVPLDNPGQKVLFGSSATPIWPAVK